MVALMGGYMLLGRGQSSSSAATPTIKPLHPVKKHVTKTVAPKAKPAAKKAVATPAKKVATKAIAIRIAPTTVRVVNSLIGRQTCAAVRRIR